MQLVWSFATAAVLIAALRGLAAGTVGRANSPYGDGFVALSITVAIPMWLWVGQANTERPWRRLGWITGPLGLLIPAVIAWPGFVDTVTWFQHMFDVCYNINVRACLARVDPSLSLARPALDTAVGIGVLACIGTLWATRPTPFSLGDVWQVETRDSLSHAVRRQLRKLRPAPWVVASSVVIVLCSTGITSSAVQAVFRMTRQNNPVPVVHATPASRHLQASNLVAVDRTTVAVKLDSDTLDRGGGFYLQGVGLELELFYGLSGGWYWPEFIFTSTHETAASLAYAPGVSLVTVLDEPD
jgi:hypothetical protein